MTNPTTLEEAVSILAKQATRDDVPTSRFHSTVGRAIRNEWGLWGDSDLAKWFKERGVTHADDMTGMIFKALDARLTGKRFNFDKEAKKYAAYWKKNGE